MKFSDHLRVHEKRFIQMDGDYIYSNQRRCRRWSNIGRKVIKSKGHSIKLKIKFKVEKFMQYVMNWNTSGYYDFTRMWGSYPSLRRVKQYMPWKNFRKRPKTVCIRIKITKYAEKQIQSL